MFEDFLEGVAPDAVNGIGQWLYLCRRTGMSMKP
jgi:hypothetical protein